MERYDAPLRAVLFSIDDKAMKHRVRLMPDGEVDSLHGMFYLDAASAALVVEKFNHHGTEVVVDFDHESMEDGKRAEAAGWVTEVWYESGEGLMAMVRWTDDARTLIRKQKFQYLSPAGFVRVADRKFVRLDSVALTNKPAIAGMQKVAASRHCKLEKHAMPNEPADNDQVLSIIADLKTIAGVESSGSMIEVLTAIRDALKTKLSGDKEADVKVAASVRDYLGISKTASAEECVVAMSTRVSGNVELSKLKGEDADRKAKELVEGYVVACKINPKDLAAMEAATTLARNDPSKLEALMSNAAPIHPVGKTSAPTGRQELILNSAREFRVDEGLQKTTSVQSFVSLQLQDAGLDRLTDDESKQLVA